MTSSFSREAPVRLLASTRECVPVAGTRTTTVNSPGRVTPACAIHWPLLTSPKLMPPLAIHPCTIARQSRPPRPARTASRTGTETYLFRRRPRLRGLSTGAGSYSASDRFAIAAAFAGQWCEQQLTTNLYIIREGIELAATSSPFRRPSTLSIVCRISWCPSIWPQLAIRTTSATDSHQ